MPRVCTVCSLPALAEVDAAIAEGRGSMRGIARQHRVSPDALERHAKAHLPAAIVKAHEVAEETRADSLLEKTQRLEEDARRLLAKAEADGDFRAAIAAVKTALDVVTLLHRVASERQSLVASPEWIAFKSRLLDALEPFADARAAVIAAFDSARGDAR